MTIKQGDQEVQNLQIRTFYFIMCAGQQHFSQL